ncbi:MAG: zinc-ribbon domain-containing protein [Atopobiaceae bacterium]|nr:zinc-ribbon domain-containing protein [Atopobiaceae bacterium]
MRCSHCGNMLEDDTELCPRCKADLSTPARMRSILITLVLVITALLAAACLTYYVLTWHDLQLMV